VLATAAAAAGLLAERLAAEAREFVPVTQQGGCGSASVEEDDNLLADGGETETTHLQHQVRACRDTSCESEECQL
jgi:hypothetical protein